MKIKKLKQLVDIPRMISIVQNLNSKLINCKDGLKKLQTFIKAIAEHIRRNTSVRSVISEHKLEFGHDFDWGNIKILDEELYLGKKLISEMFYIKKQTNSINFHNCRYYLLYYLTLADIIRYNIESHNFIPF